MQLHQPFALHFGESTAGAAKAWVALLWATGVASAAVSPGTGFTGGVLLP